VDHGATGCNRANAKVTTEKERVKYPSETKDMNEEDRVEAGLTKFSAERPIISGAPGMGYFWGKPDPVHNK
jgi:hypothetical protein